MDILDELHKEFLVKYTKKKIKSGFPEADHLLPYQ